MSEPICSTDRWTCPECGRNVVVDGSDADIRCALRACQQRHAEGHRAAREVLLRFDMQEAHPPPRRGATIPKVRRRRAA